MKIADNPKFHDTWENLQKSLTNILTIIHTDPPYVQILYGEIEHAKGLLNNIRDIQIEEDKKNGWKKLD